MDHKIIPGFAIASLLIFCSAVTCEESIQGRTFKDRVNGIYDTSVSNKQIEDFLSSLQAAVREDSAEKLAKLVVYPCRAHGKIVNNSQDFIKLYPTIMTGSLKKLILSTKLDDLFVNYQGFMLGNGEIWFTPAGIITFN